MSLCVHAPIPALLLSVSCRCVYVSALLYLLCYHSISCSCVCLSLQEDMLQNRREEFENSIVELTSWDGFVKALDDKKMVRTPWCDNTHVFSLV